MKLHGDFETRSTLDLKAVGLDNYAKHPSTDVWVFCYAFDDEEVKTWLPGDPVQKPLADCIADGGLFYAHNAAFEFAIWQNILVPRYGFPSLDIRQMRCTMAMAYAMSLPGSLEKAAAAVGIKQQKDLHGQRTMLQMCQPRRIDGDNIIWWDDLDRRLAIYNYCAQDVRVERELEKRLLPLSADEQKLWLLDQKINNRGVYIDLSAIDGALKIVESEQQRLDAELNRTTRGYVSACTNVNQLTDYIRLHGVETKGVAKADITELLESELPPPVRQALILRQEGGKSSTAKFKAMREAASADGRVRGTMQYHGAGPGRWAGRRIQPHNMPRPTMGFESIELMFPYIEKADPRAISVLFGPPMQRLADAVRSFIRAAPGNVLMAGDYTAVEAIGLPWLAGDEDALNEFRLFQAKKGDEPYCIMASDIFRKPINKKKNPDERQIGKVTILQLGYEGGIGAWITASRGYGIKLEMLLPVLDTANGEELDKAEWSADRFYKQGGDKKIPKNVAMACDVIKQRFRVKREPTRRYWRDLENAVVGAVEVPGRVTTVGKGNAQVKYRVKGSFLWCQLPSGRVICYPYPRLKEVETPWGEKKPSIRYKTNDINGKWIEVETYGGKIAQNNTEAICRDLLAGALTRLEAAGYPPVFHVHDEAVSEVNERFGSLDEMLALMKPTEKWAKGLPIAVEGWRGVRFRKG